MTYQLFNSKLAMVSAINWQPTDGLMVQADWLGQKVGRHLVLCCIHCMNWLDSAVL